MTSAAARLNSTYLRPKLRATPNPRSLYEALARRHVRRACAACFSISRTDGPVSFFLALATFHNVPSGACTTPPNSHSDL